MSLCALCTPLLSISENYRVNSTTCKILYRFDVLLNFISVRLLYPRRIITNTGILYKLQKKGWGGSDIRIGYGLTINVACIARVSTGGGQGWRDGQDEGARHRRLSGQLKPPGLADQQTTVRPSVIFDVHVKIFFININCLRL